jgi:hypothetical protein
MGIKKEKVVQWVIHECIIGRVAWWWGRQE